MFATHFTTRECREQWLEFLSIATHTRVNPVPLHGGVTYVPAAISTDKRQWCTIRMRATNKQQMSNK